MNAPAPSAQIQLFFDGDDFFRDVISHIDEAVDEIWIETYIFDMDRVGRRFIQALTEARRRKVSVNLMVDGVGSILSIEKLHQLTEKNHIEFRVFHPPLFYSRLSHGRRALPLGRWLRALIVRLQSAILNVNRRNHRKTVIIDGKVAFIGSFNVTEVHSNEYRDLEAWRDTGARIRADADLHPLMAAFQKTWMRARDLDRPRFSFRRRFGKSIRRENPKLFRLNDSFRRRFRSNRELRRRIRRAKKRILITNAYFLPRPAFLRLLRDAARRGVFVGLVLPAKTDVWMVREAGRTMMRKLIKDGVQVYEYQPSILHAKTMIIDDWAIVGSHNLNHRSFFHDLEVDLMLTEAPLIQQLVEHWDQDVKVSHALTIRELDQDSWLRQLVGRMVYLARYWM